MMEFDDRYLALMGLYKKLRIDPAKEAASQKAFQAAAKLLESGSVSPEAQEIARYI